MGDKNKLYFLTHQPSITTTPKMAAYLTRRLTHPHHAVEVSRPATPSQEKDKKCAEPIFNIAAEDVPFFTPAQNPPPGTAIVPEDKSKKLPKLFTPIKIRDLVMPNRLWVSPMCQYSAHEGFHTPWHVTHYGGMAQRGPGLLMVEATAVQANGRITPEDSGIWLDAHIDTLRKHVQFAHSQNAKIAIQLAHAGRKASTVAPWLSSGATAEKVAGGWPDDVYGPSEEPFDPHYPTPRAMTLKEIEQLKEDFVKAALRSIDAGFDVLELHFAHGYLVSSFLSPATNKRTDQYGGSFENRTRLALELAEAVRAVMPKGMPLFARISATDWLEENPDFPESWTVEQSAEFAKLLAQTGVDAEAIISGGKDEGDVPIDLIAAGRMFQKNPGLVWAFADDLGIEVRVANQIGWGFGGRGGKKTEYVKLGDA